MSKKNKNKKAAGKSVATHPFDDMEKWLGADFSRPPAPQKWIDNFQARIDDAFGAKGLFRLAWSGDQNYWEEYAIDWYPSGDAKAFEKRPILLWQTIPVNERDYIYVYPPRWIILEKWFPEQYAPDWETNVWIQDAALLGKRKQMRPLKPPETYYGFWKTCATHNRKLWRNIKPICCAAADAENKMCYGKYRLPNEDDLIALKRMRRDMDERKAQRPDEPLTKRSLEEARLTSKYYRKQTVEAKAQAVMDLGQLAPSVYLGDLESQGIHLSPREQEEIVREALLRNTEQEFKEQKL